MTSPRNKPSSPSRIAVNPMGRVERWICGKTAWESGPQEQQMNDDWFVKLGDHAVMLFVLIVLVLLATGVIA